MKKERKAKRFRHGTGFWDFFKDAFCLRVSWPEKYTDEWPTYPGSVRILTDIEIQGPATSE